MPCPRCGEAYDRIEEQEINGRVYLYAVHYEDGKKRRCYLGPAEGYRYVAWLTKLDTLTNLSDLDYMEVAVQAASRAFRHLLKRGYSKEEALKRIFEAIKNEVGMGDSV
mgnify:CR=1 FL=1